MDLVRLDSGVFATIRRDPLSLAVNSNSLIFVRDTDVVVVDAQFTRLATQETIAAVRSITKRPVSYVINTHWHDDHVAGDQVYQDSFPSVRFVMQENTATDTVHRRMSLGQGRDRVDILWFGSGNTRGDLVVHLPSRGIAAAGDLVERRFPSPSTPIRHRGSRSWIPCWHSTRGWWSRDTAR